MQCSPVESQRPNPATNKCARFNSCPQSNDANVIAVANLELARELWRNLCEHFRLQLRKVAEKPRHAASRMMFGQAIRGQHEWKSGIARWREPVLATRKPMFRRVGLPRIQIGRA